MKEAGQPGLFPRHLLKKGSMQKSMFANPLPEGDILKLILPDTSSESESGQRLSSRSLSLRQSGTMCTMQPICIRNKLVGSSRVVPTGLVVRISLTAQKILTLPGGKEIDRPDVQIFGCFCLAWLGEIKRVEVSA